MTRVLSLRNRQRVRAVDTALLRRLTRWLLAEHFHASRYELGLHLVNASEMARVNQTYLKHDGSTDVITFDHRDEELRVPGSGFRVKAGAPQLETRSSKLEAELHGEIFICLHDAVAQAREFQTAWQSELVRYVIHGLLHLHGHDDLKSAARRAMKREENRLLRATAKHFDLSQLGTRNPKRGTPNPSP